MGVARFGVGRFARSSFLRVLESWSVLVRLYFSHVWERIHAFLHGDSKEGVLCVLFGRWRASPPKEEVIAEIIDVIQRTKDPDLIEGLGLLVQKACLDPVILARMKHIALCADRIDKLDSGPFLYALRVERESKALIAGVIAPGEITCRPMDLLKHVRPELHWCDAIPTTYRILSTMRDLEIAALEDIDRDERLTAEEKRHLTEETVLAGALAYSSWADRQLSNGIADRVAPQEIGARGRLTWGVN